ncbi:MAG: hypothetical protein D6753_17245, partial [Planctomycetota bacterium]
DLIEGSGWLSLAAFTVGVPIFIHLLASLVGVKSTWRFCIVVAASALIATLLWMRQVNTGRYRITIGPEVVFVASLVQFTIGAAIIEAGFGIVSWYVRRTSHSAIEGDRTKE